MNKLLTRADFRKGTFGRDGYRCIGCGLFFSEDKLDAHHITDRSEIPYGGYVKENGATLCKHRCHLMAEAEHQGIEVPEGFSRKELYTKVSSSYDLAYQKSLEFGESALWPEIEKVILAEEEICKILNNKCPNTWGLACESLKVSDVLILNYGKYRP